MMSDPQDARRAAAYANLETAIFSLVAAFRDDDNTDVPHRRGAAGRHAERRRRRRSGRRGEHLSAIRIAARLHHDRSARPLTDDAPRGQPMKYYSHQSDTPRTPAGSCQPLLFRALSSTRATPVPKSRTKRCALDANPLRSLIKRGARPRRVTRLRAPVRPRSWLNPQITFAQIVYLTRQNGGKQSHAAAWLLWHFGPHAPPGGVTPYPSTHERRSAMPNSNWGQRSRIPKRVKDQVRRRDQRCQLEYPGICTGAIDEFDHPDGLAAQDQHRAPVRSASEVQGVCSPCHEVKTDRQRRAGVAQAQQRRGSLSKRYRDIEPHPGLIRR